MIILESLRIQGPSGFGFGVSGLMLQGTVRSTSAVPGLHNIPRQKELRSSEKVALQCSKPKNKAENLSRMYELKLIAVNHIYVQDVLA